MRDHQLGKIWRFHRAYRHIPLFTGLSHIKISEKFVSKVKASEMEQKPFYGFNDEFGPKGEVTKKTFPRYYKKRKEYQTDFGRFILEYFRNNFIGYQK